MTGLFLTGVTSLVESFAVGTDGLRFRRIEIVDDFRQPGADCVAVAGFAAPQTNGLKTSSDSVFNAYSLNHPVSNALAQLGLPFLIAHALSL